MTNAAVIIWILTTQHFDDAWVWIIAVCVVIDLIHIGYKLATHD